MRISLLYRVINLTIPIMLLFTACSSEKYVSSWNEDAITVDGDQSDWRDRLKYIEDERVAIGVINDEKNLYLCLTTDERGKIMQLLNLGMTIWIKPDDGMVKTIGIKYPISSGDFDMRSMRRNPQGESDADFLRKILAGFQEKQNELQIVNDDNYSLYAYPINDGSGIKIQLGESLQQFVYEMSIPLAGNNMSEFQIDLYPGDILTVGFETNEFQMPEGGRGGNMMGGGQPSGGMTGRGSSGTGMGERSTMPRGSMQERPEPIDVEIDIKLAKAPRI